MKEIIVYGYVFLGGGLGSICRFGLGVWAKHYFKAVNYPMGTFIANMLGCLFMGVMIGLLGKYGKLNSELYLLGVIGFCGGFTTFSSFAFENQSLWKSGDYLTFTIYLMSSFILGILAVVLGLFIAKNFF